MKKGDIVLIPFPFTDLTGVKTRPALILAVFDSTLIVSFITSRLKWQAKSDISIVPDEQNGLKKPSVIRLNKITTLDKELIIGKLGSLAKDDLKNINEELASMLQLNVNL